MFYHRGVKHVYTHPANVALLRDALSIHRNDGPPIPMVGVAIHESRLLPERSIKRRWFPPANDRFVTYEEKDHCWLRALGFGAWRDVDEGPLFLELQRPEFNWAPRIPLSSIF